MKNNCKEYIKIFEGAYIPQTKYVLRLENTPYELYRLVMNMVSPETYVETSKKGSRSILMFYDQHEFEKAKNFLTTAGVKFANEEKILQHDFPEADSRSPYPSNNHSIDPWS